MTKPLDPNRRTNHNPHPVSPAPETINRNGKWWVFNRMWVYEEALVRELRKFAPGHGVAEMECHVGLWNIDRAQFLEFLKKHDITPVAWKPMKMIRGGPGVGTHWVDESAEVPVIKAKRSGWASINARRRRTNA